MNLFDAYKGHASSYDVLDLPLEDLKKLVLPLQHHKHEKGFDEYLALKWAGDFFAYNRHVCWVYIVNNKTAAKINMRHYKQGFYITITTADDAALYGDWKKCLSKEKMEEVIRFFNKLPALRNYNNMCKDLNKLIGVNGTFENS